jgi:hydroxymethylpyrimidine/phosphomethylpyrimidine kinase
MKQRPHVLILSGLDPSGGAGLQADIQAVTAMGCHPLPVLTCLTVQDTANVLNAQAVDPDFIRQQLDCLVNDVPIHAIKTGALGSTDIVEMLTGFLAEHREYPLVVDPVIKAAGGGALADGALVYAMATRLFPLATVITPNGIELAPLGGSNDAAEAANTLLKKDCPAVFATGGHGSGETITNQLYRRDMPTKEWSLTRRGGEFHGSGCTLASALAAGLASGKDLETAIEAAQAFVSDTITEALTVGKGQPVPDRAMVPAFR